MRTWASGRVGVPPIRRSARSSPSSSTRARKASTRRSVSIKKSAGRTSPARFDGETMPLLGVVKPQRHAEIGDHATVPATRASMRMELLGFVSRAVRRNGDVPNAEGASSVGQQGAQVDFRGSGVGSPREAFGDFITYFKTSTTNAYATMHYEFTR